MFQSEFSKAFSLYSDLYKDVWGSRPRNHAKWERLGLEALNNQIDKLQEEVEAIIEAELEEGAKWYDLEPIEYPQQDAEYLARCEAEEIALQAQKAEEARELQWVHWEVLEMNLIGLRHR